VRNGKTGNGHEADRTIGFTALFGHWGCDRARSLIRVIHDNNSYHIFSHC
jgi:hypothetical protein